MNFYEDSAMKRLAREALSEQFTYWGIDFDFGEELPTEIQTPYYGSLTMDYNCRVNSNERLHAEFQSTKVNLEDMKRFFSYAALEFIDTGERIHTFVISSYDEKFSDELLLSENNTKIFAVNNDDIGRDSSYNAFPSRSLYWHGLNDKLTIYFILFKQMDADKALNRMKRIVKNNEYIKPSYGYELNTIPFMKSEKSEVDLLFEVAELTNEIENIEIERFDKIKSIQWALGEKFIGKDDIKTKSAFLEVLKMKGNIFDRAIQSAKDLYFEQGKSKILSDMLKNGYSLDEIHKITNISKDEIVKLKKIAESCSFL